MADIQAVAMIYLPGQQHGFPPGSVLSGLDQESASLLIAAGHAVPVPAADDAAPAPDAAV